MHKTSAARLRLACATMMLALGILLIAQLWYLPLSAANVLVASSGFGCLLLALGLFGVSRFTLLLTGVLAATRALTGWAALPMASAADWESLRSGVELLLACCCLWLLWAARHRPSH